MWTCTCIITLTIPCFIRLYHRFHNNLAESSGTFASILLRWVASLHPHDFAESDLVAHNSLLSLVAPYRMYAHIISLDRFEQFASAKNCGLFALFLLCWVATSRSQCFAELHISSTVLFWVAPAHSQYFAELHHLVHSTLLNCTISSTVLCWIAHLVHSTLLNCTSRSQYFSELHHLNYSLFFFFCWGIPSRPQ